MGNLTREKPHLVVVPFPAQGHITPILTLAKLLHSKDFYITFVHTEYNHRRLVAAGGPDAVKGLNDFRFEAIPDGLPAADCDGTQDIPALCQSIANNVGAHFLVLLKRLNAAAGVPPVTCVISDGVMSVTLDAAEEMGIPEYVFYTPSACGTLCYLHYPELIQRGYVPLKGNQDY